MTRTWLQSEELVLTGSSGLQSEDLGYPATIPSLDFSIPLPETFDPILQLAQGGQFGASMLQEGFRFADDGVDRIDTIVFPEAKSASLLSQVLQHTTGRPNAHSPWRETLQAAIVEHARSIVSTPWKDGSRYGALSLAYT